jgi:putative phosphoesterase
MKVGVISDTHDHLPTLRRAIALFTRLKVEAIFHAGDLVAPFAAKVLAPDKLTTPLHVIYGNNDGERQGLKTILPGIVDGPLTIKIGGRTIAMAHSREELTPASIKPADVVIYGHTHEIVNEVIDGKRHLNPGECCGWVTDRCSIALLDLETLEAEVVDVHDGP